jgi:hypothetical protein
VRQQIDGPRANDAWARADLATALVLSGDDEETRQEAEDYFRSYAKAARPRDIGTTLRILGLAERQLKQMGDPAGSWTAWGFALWSARREKRASCAWHEASRVDAGCRHGGDDLQPTSHMMQLHASAHQGNRSAIVTPGAFTSISTKSAALTLQGLRVNSHDAEALRDIALVLVMPDMPTRRSEAAAPEIRGSDLRRGRLFVRPSKTMLTLAATLVRSLTTSPAEVCSDNPRNSADQAFSPLEFWPFWRNHNRSRPLGSMTRRLRTGSEPLCWYCTLFNRSARIQIFLEELAKPAERESTGILMLTRAVFLRQHRVPWKKPSSEC